VNERGIEDQGDGDRLDDRINPRNICKYQLILINLLLLYYIYIYEY